MCVCCVYTCLRVRMSVSKCIYLSLTPKLELLIDKQGQMKDEIAYIVMTRYHCTCLINLTSILTTRTDYGFHWERITYQIESLITFHRGVGLYDGKK